MASTALVQVEGVTKRFGPVVAVERATFSVRRGEVLGFLGPNGAGKTTTMRMITGFYSPDEGRVLVDGADIQEHDLEVKQRIGYLPENNPLYEEMPVGEHLGFTARLRGVPPARRKAAIERAVEETSLEEVFYRPVGQLSRGYRQRVGLATAILHEPDVLILDEPTEGLDPNQRIEIRDLIRELGRVHTVILSTHVLQEVENTCHRLLVIHRGRLVADGPAEALVQQAHGGRRLVVELETDGAAADLTRLRGVERLVSEEVLPGRRRYVLAIREGAELRPRVFATAKERGWVLWELHEEAPRLEEIFRTLTLSD